MEGSLVFILAVSAAVALYGFAVSAFSTALVGLVRRKIPRAGDFSETVSVIIAARNEAGRMEGLLKQMLRQDFPVSRMEVIVSDDDSTDGTLAVVHAFGASHPGFPLRIVTTPSGTTGVKGKKGAIGRAVAIAGGAVLLFTDADTERGPGWITSMTGMFSDPGTCMVLGPVALNGGRSLLREIQSLEFLGLMGVTAGSAELGFPVMSNGANLAYRRGLFNRAGGFTGNERFLSGDDQFMLAAARRDRFAKGGTRFNLAPEAVVTTEPESTLRGFAAQRIRWVSKSRGYRDPAVIATGLVTFLAHALLSAGLAAALFKPVLAVPILALWVLKALADLPTVLIMGRFFGKKVRVLPYLAAQAFQVVYVTLAGTVGLFLPFTWKGRRG